MYLQILVRLRYTQSGAVIHTAYCFADTSESFNSIKAAVSCSWPLTCNTQIKNEWRHTSILLYDLTASLWTEHNKVLSVAFDLFRDGRVPEGIKIVIFPKCRKSLFGNNIQESLTFRNPASYIKDGHTDNFNTPHFYILSTNTRTEFFKHAAHSPFLSLQIAVYSIKLPFLVPVLFTFYIQGVLKN
jgi:hypothetical protein